MTSTPISPGVYALIALVACAVAAPLYVASIRFCHSKGLLDYPDKRKRHGSPTPNIGGVGLFVTLIVVIGSAKIFFPGLFNGLTAPWLSLALGAGVVFAVGLVDDLHPLDARVKLAAQALAGLILYLGGVAPEVVNIPFVGEAQTGIWGALITITWVVALTNAINLIDGLDGLAAGVSLISCASIFTTLYLLNVGVGALICSALAGALVGFLFFNLHPAKLFLGDSGALLVGYTFAAVSLLAPVKSFTSAALFLPLVALAIPLIEVASSTMRRLASGKGVFQGDRRHLFHYLGYLGLSPRATVRVFWLAGGVFGGLAVSMLFWDRVLAVSVLALVMVAVLGAILILAQRLRRNGTSAFRRRSTLTPTDGPKQS